MNSNSEQNQRQPGWYFTRLTDHSNYEPTYWNGFAWFEPYKYTKHGDEKLHEIDPTPITRNTAGGPDDLRAMIDETIECVWNHQMPIDYAVSEIERFYTSHPAQAEPQEGGKDEEWLQAEAAHLVSLIELMYHKTPLIQKAFKFLTRYLAASAPQPGKPEPEGGKDAIFPRPHIPPFLYEKGVIKDAKKHRVLELPGWVQSDLHNLEPEDARKYLNEMGNAIANFLTQWNK